MKNHVADDFRREISLFFDKLKRNSKNIHSYHFTPPVALLPELQRRTAAQNINLLCKFVECCPFCDSSRYESLLRYPNLSSPFLSTKLCRFDPWTGGSLLCPLLVPFSLSTEELAHVVKLIETPITYTLNCPECSQVFHLDCARRFMSQSSEKQSYVFPLSYIREAAHKKYWPNMSGKPFPEASLSHHSFLCADCNFVPSATASSACSRCWRCLSLSMLSSVRIKNLPKDMPFLQEWVCNECLKCSHCFIEGAVDAYFSDPNRQDLFTNKAHFWTSFMVSYDPPFSLLFCENCVSALEAGEYCSVCYQLFDIHNISTPLLDCHKCKQKIHVGCNAILNNGHHYIGPKGNSDTEYVCYKCSFQGCILDIEKNIQTSVSSLSPFPSGTWILDCGVAASLSTPHLPTIWKSRKDYLWPLGFHAARYVPSFKKPGTNTLLFFRVVPGWDSENENPYFQLQFGDDMANTYKMAFPEEWKELYRGLWMENCGIPPPSFSAVESIEALFRPCIKRLENLSHSLPVPLPCSKFNCSRTLPFHRRKQVARPGGLRFAINNNEITYLDNYLLKDSLVIGRSPIQGLGIFAKKPIEADVPLLPYYGIIISPHVAETLERLYDSLGLGCYFFRISSSKIIDATLFGSTARFVNHSCEPNCIAKSVCSLKLSSVYKQRHKTLECSISCRASCSLVIICSKRKILPEEELTYDYMFNHESDPLKRIPCGCKSIKCRGYMN